MLLVIDPTEGLWTAENDGTPLRLVRGHGGLTAFQHADQKYADVPVVDLHRQLRLPDGWLARLFRGYPPRLRPHPEPKVGENVGVICWRITPSIQRGLVVQAWPYPLVQFSEDADPVRVWRRRFVV
ncbi:MAG: hypothetical protein AAGF47_05625 [Planctomycetota bacterium]